MELQIIRENERKSHTQLYTTVPLYSDGSWLKKPVKTVIDLLPLFHNYRKIQVLDLGCGVGRNSIAIAQHFSSISCRIDCVDILDIAIQKLNQNAEKFHTESSIVGIVSSIEDFPIPPSTYDLILAISALEHVASEASLIFKLSELRDGTRDNGIICLVMNSNVREFDKTCGTELPAQFEVNLPTEKILSILQSIFAQWNIIKLTQNLQHYEIPRSSGPANLYSTVITFVAQK